MDLADVFVTKYVDPDPVEERGKRAATAGCNHRGSYFGVLLTLLKLMSERLIASRSLPITT